MGNVKPFALLMNDIHVSKDNIPEFKKNWNEALDLCRKHDVRTMIIGGDLWQSRSAQPLSVLMAVREAVIDTTDLGISLYIAEGNHCKVDQEDTAGYSEIFQGYRLVEVIPDWTELSTPDRHMHLYIISYFPEDGSFTEKLDEVKGIMDQTATNVLYIHEGIRGGLAKSTDKELPASLFSCFDSTLVGHYHDRKQIPGTSIQYIGASRQHSFGEDEHKGYTLLYSDGSNEFIENQANVRYKTLDVPAKKLTDEYLTQLKSSADDARYKIRLRVSCQAKEVSGIDRQRLSDTGISKLEFVTEETEITLGKGQDFSNKFDKDGIREEYKTFCDGKHIDNVDFGLKYINKIGQLCGDSNQ